ncbi:tether containing UBX domain for GLUT4 [Condylostylus longicornis]|uniref:tether containing UBX domain for GLUT4 n=1 Tax=Condylostylus longicornis TaxID=2530218 RepID=UPI00244DBA08|nr:tether containing UBX domain for GLUT4 [Condylostylus longicornis]
MSQKVTVLTTNGRRQNVPVTPNTTLLQVLEQVCQKHNFKSNEHGLKHFNKVQDLTLTFRFSGLPNNCLLEMFETDKPREEDGDVTLCVQLENGERVQGSFKPNQTVEFILNNLCQDQFSCMENPIVFYMRQEIYGDALKSTNLKNLGITTGRAIVRLLNRNPDDLKTQANVYVPPTPKPSEPKEENERKSKKELKESSGINVAEVIKSSKTENDNKQSLESENIEKNKIEITEAKEENLTTNKSEADKKPQYSWGEGAGRIMNEEQTNQLPIKEDMDTTENEPIVYELGERHAIVFSLESVQKTSEEIPDSFFELTTNDLKLLLRDLRKEAMGNEEAPLLTAKMRELEESKKILRKMEQYKHCVIRIQFPDRLVLQGTFRSIESIDDVHNFVKKYLKNPEITFHLFTIPPKKILNVGLSLLEADCVPAAVLHFGIDNKENISDNYLLPELYTKLTSPEGALSVIKSKGLLFSDSTKDEFCQQPSSSSSSSPSKGAIPKKPKNEEFIESKTVAASSDKSGVVPKWFKPIKK